MSRYRPACALVALGVILGGCGASGSSSAFRSSYAAAEPGLRSIEVALEGAVTSARESFDAQLTSRWQALAARAAQEGTALVGLDHPPRYNTRLRALGSTLEAAARDLGGMTAAAASHSPAATAAATRALQTDAAQVSAVEATLAGSLGLPGG